MSPAYWALIVIIFILIIILAIAISQWVGLSAKANDILLSAPIFSGGSISAEADDIIAALQPYTDETRSTYLTNYLERYWNYTRYKIRRLKARVGIKTAGVIKDTKAQDKYYRALVNDIIEKEEITDFVEFVDKSNLTYSAFIPADLKKILNKAHRRNIQPDGPSFRYLKRIFENMLVKPIHDVDHWLDKFLHNNKLYKFKAINTLRGGRIKSHDLEYDIDYIGLLPFLKSYVKQLNHGKINDMALFRKYLNKIGLLDLTLYDNLSAFDIAKSLQKLTSPQNEHSRAEISRLTQMVDELKKNSELKEAQIKSAKLSLDEEKVKKESLESELDRMKRVEMEEKNKKEAEKKAKEEADEIRRMEKGKDKVIEEEEPARPLEESTSAPIPSNFDEKLKENPELTNVANALGMTLEELRDEYELERERTGSAEDDAIIIQKLKKRLMDI